MLKIEKLINYMSTADCRLKIATLRKLLCYLPERIIIFRNFYFAF